MAVRTKQLFAPTAIAAGANALLYTVPSGETTIVKTLTICTESAVQVRARLYIGAVAVGNLVLIKPLGGLGDLASTYAMFMVLQPGQVLRGAAETGAITFAGFGTELEGVAD